MTVTNLTEHVRVDHIGTGKSRYQCFWKNCPRKNRTFNKRHKMYDHFRTHTGEKPYECSNA
ncbi:hypothetical protein BC941DRAFT_517912, partial [Chlamydoabsidia padenii]